MLCRGRPCAGPQKMAQPMLNRSNIIRGPAEDRPLQQKMYNERLANQGIILSLQVELKRRKNMEKEYSNDEKLEWTMIFIHEFGKKYGLNMKQSFGYLSRFKGIDFIDNHYGFVHTQSFTSMVDDIAGYCKRQGGRLE